MGPLMPTVFFNVGPSLGLGLIVMSSGIPVFTELRGAAPNPAGPSYHLCDDEPPCANGRGKCALGLIVAPSSVPKARELRGAPLIPAGPSYRLRDDGPPCAVGCGGHSSGLIVGSSVPKARELRGPELHQFLSGPHTVFVTMGLLVPLVVVDILQG
jgi:hypothetical protein